MPLLLNNGLLFLLSLLLFLKFQGVNNVLGDLGKSQLKEGTPSLAGSQMSTRSSRKPVIIITRAQRGLTSVETM